MHGWHLTEQTWHVVAAVTLSSDGWQPVRLLVCATFVCVMYVWWQLWPSVVMGGSLRDQHCKKILVFHLLLHAAHYVKRDAVTSVFYIYLTERLVYLCNRTPCFCLYVPAILPTPARSAALEAWRQGFDQGGFWARVSMSVVVRGSGRKDSVFTAARIQWGGKVKY